MRRVGLAAAALLVALGAAGVAQAEVEQQGDVIVNFDGGISPRALPRTGVAPVAVTIDSSFKIRRRGRPAAAAADRSRSGSTGAARSSTAACRPAGCARSSRRRSRRRSGSAAARSSAAATSRCVSTSPTSRRSPSRARCSSSTPKRSGGDRRLLAQVYGLQAAVGLRAQLQDRQRAGRIRHGDQDDRCRSRPRKWAYVTHFDMKLRRIYTYQGQKHSYVSAGCAAPDGFPGAVYAFAAGELRLRRRAST